MEKFTKVKNIGKGNMGACALARNNEDGRYYVIKQVDLAKLNKKERQQSLNEAKVLSSLRHPNVINYIDSFLARKSDHLCIVMEFADGGDISNRIKNNHGINFTESQILDWLIQIVLSLHYVHQRKILHRDVKTQNIFLTQENLVKLGDFGIARTLSSTYDQASTFVGTPYYLSPELILERPYDHMSDVWALGVVLYELMALKHPFNANDMKSLMHRILKVQYDPPPTMYSNDLRNIVAKILVKDPLQRMRLGEILELPYVTKRVKQWLDGGVMPAKYVASLIRNKLLPPHLMSYAMQQAQQGGGGVSSSGVPQSQSVANIEESTSYGNMPSGYPPPPPHRSPDKYVSSALPPLSNQVVANAAPAVRPKEEAPQVMAAPPKYVSRVAEPPPPQETPMYVRKQPLALETPTANVDYQVYRTPSMAVNSPGLPPPPARYAPAPSSNLPPLNANVGGGGVYRAYQAQQDYVPVRQLAPLVAPRDGGGMPPPLRPQNSNVPYGGVAAAMHGHRQMQQAQIQQHNNDIQAMLQRAALERAQRQKMLR